MLILFVFDINASLNIIITTSLNIHFPLPSLALYKILLHERTASRTSSPLFAYCAAIKQLPVPSAARITFYWATFIWNTALWQHVQDRVDTAAMFLYPTVMSFSRDTHLHFFLTTDTRTACTHTESCQMRIGSSLSRWVDCLKSHRHSKPKSNELLWLEKY